MTALTSIAIRHFQSLTDVSLTLAPFTVIVGPSSSGKSAFVRALQTLTRNQRGSAFITQGKPGCSITATLPTATVSLIRSKSSSATDAYVLDRSPSDPSIIGTQRYTKLGGSTPPEVTQVLGQMADPAAVASQFDPPYLLTQSPAEAARTLAALTGSDIVLEAAREANRRRLEATATLRTKTIDHIAVQEELAAHQDHQAESEHLEAAEPHLIDALALLHQCAHLQTLLDGIDHDAFGVKLLRESLAELAPVPTLTELEVLHDTHRALALSIADVTSRAYATRDLRSTLDRLNSEIFIVTTRYDETLHALGVCPVCGSAT